jgi:two-component system, cell cycle response regulator DivK
VTNYGGRRPLALVVDDDADNQELFAQVLRLSGFNTIRAGSGPEALLKAGVSRPDLIVLDLWLPGKDGYQVIRELKSQSETAFIPVLVVSGRVTAADSQQAYEVGCDGFLGKPCMPEVLMEEVGRLYKGSCRDSRGLF